MRSALLVACMLLLGACGVLRKTPPSPAPAPAPEAPPVAAPPPVEAPPPKKPKPHPKPAPAAVVPAKPVAEGLAPEDVGYYMDVMQGRLKQTVGNSVGVTRSGNRIVITSSAQFDASTGKAELDVAQSRPFAGIAKVLKEYNNTRVTLRTRSIDGAIAPDSAARAACEQALLRYFTGAGVAADQLNAVAGAHGDNPSTVKSAYFEIDIEPALREAAAHSNHDVSRGC